MARGGKRPGAGRKKGVASILAEKTHAYAAEQLEKYKKPIIAALVKKAKKGDVFAVRELWDRAHGRPQQYIDHTSDGDKLPVPIMGGVSTDEDVSADNSVPKNSKS